MEWKETTQTGGCMCLMSWCCRRQAGAHGRRASEVWQGQGGASKQVHNLGKVGGGRVGSEYTLTQCVSRASRWQLSPLDQTEVTIWWRGRIGELFHTSLRACEWYPLHHTTHWPPYKDTLGSHVEDSILLCEPLLHKHMLTLTRWTVSLQAYGSWGLTNSRWPTGYGPLEKQHSV